MDLRPLARCAALVLGIAGVVRSRAQPAPEGPRAVQTAKPGQHSAESVPGTRLKAKPKPKPRSVSEVRLEVLRQITRRQVRTAAANVRSNAIAESVLRELARLDEFPAKPGPPAVTPEQIIASAKARTRALLKTRTTEPARADLEARGAEAYPIYEAGQAVTVTYQLSPAKTVTYTGIFRGTTDTAVIVGSRRILLRDIEAAPDNAQALLAFDRVASMEQREKTVREALRRYGVAKRGVEREIRALCLKEERAKALNTNQKNGYILYRGKWAKPVDIVTVLIRGERERLRREEAGY